MNTFRMRVQAGIAQTVVENVASFIGEDASGQFGILPGREPLVTVLEPGLARFRTPDAPWRYVAISAATLRFDGRDLDIATRRFLLGDDYRALSEALERQAAAEESHRTRLRSNLRQLERAMFERLWNLERR
ncbi:MAG: F0F1 ATP synthase subunit epsilon [Betaproteobacteria bacterium]|nr:F0F1 ATP synthase subunit epsilon [Betaproteobacteria bacterium]